MPSAWRLVKKEYAASAFDGEGARRFGGRWNSKGTAVVYCAESVSLAALEILTRLHDATALGAYSLIPVTFPDRVVTRVATDDLPADWASFPGPTELRSIGDTWVAQRTSAVLRVPSALVPTEANYLINPQHPDFATVDVAEPQDFALGPSVHR